jgi:DNA helicase-2/ATP-dependent DNA helicase PcrA
MNSDIMFEKTHLSYVLDNIEQLIKLEEQNLNGLPSKYKKDAFLLQDLMIVSYAKLQNLKRAPKKPYFARIDFKQDGAVNENRLYIGKVGFFDQNNNIMITDWRAPVSSVYYDGNLGETSYEAPIGTINGELKLKRQIMIENSELKEIFDVDSVSVDEILGPYLRANADSRLKSIVASIQKEQNEIIRANLHSNVIVQGVAGSGKTTVALHRIAYLIYNYSKKFKADQFMVIGPNKFFIKYISSVLPDLDVGNAKQSTFVEFAEEYINESFGVSDATASLVALVNGINPPEYLRYKLSMEYKVAIDKFVEDFVISSIPKEGLCSNGFTILTKQQILDEINSYVNVENISNQFVNTVQRLKSNIEKDRELYDKISNYFKDLAKDLESDSKREVYSQEFSVKTELKTCFDKALKKILNLKSKKVIALYKNFIANIEKYIDDITIAKEIKAKTSKMFTKKNFEFEDVAALMYLKFKLFGEADYKNFAHVVVDEAQDLGEFNFYVLKKILSKSTFSIFGDLTQGIYSYRSINNWEQVKNSTFENKCEIMNLEKSFRTTIEILLSANNISKHLSLGEGTPVIRHGEPVKLTKLDVSKKPQYVLEKINKAKTDGMKSIAVICKTPKESEELVRMLSKENQDIQLITEDNDDYNGGICVLTSYLSKGLEFDSVIVYNVDDSEYDASNEIDMKLLYVAMTRALHTLELIYSTKPTKPVKNI